MDINDIKHLAVERIYLIPDTSEGQLGYCWCDDPAPSEGMVVSEAVEYVRKDVHDAIIKRQASSARMGMNAAKEHGSHMEAAAKRLHAECNPEALESERAANALLTERITQLEADCAAHKAAEEVQIALREKAEEREQVLAAHVERIKEGVLELESLCFLEDSDFPEMLDFMRDEDETPIVSLDRRDAEQQKIGAASFKSEAQNASVLPVRVHLEGVFSVWMSKHERGLL